MSKDTPRNPKAQAQKDLRQEKQQLNAAEAAKRLAEERLELHVQFAVLEKDQREYELERRPESRLNPLVGLEDWIATYRHTRYKVEGLSSPIVLGQLNPEVDALLTTHLSPNVAKPQSWAYLTAWNPMSKALPLKQNIRRNEMLKKELQSYTVIPGIGESLDGIWAEESFLVIGIELFAAKLTAGRHQQRAFLFAEAGKAAELYVRFDMGMPYHSAGIVSR
ncbi:MAG: DUF3293 domain-containing protein [Bacteroidetes bacterium]|nr:DUF3293 domain-containing protein [Bacteroidota bacterium]